MLAVIKEKIFTKEFGVQIISMLFIILFTYAAISKLLKYEDFKLQLSQSPFLSAYADALSWGIPASELTIAALFFFPKLNLEGLWSSFLLMLIFTTYIITVLNFSDYIPCSCGGIISSLSWNQHLYFNIGFIILAACGILLAHPRKKIPNSHKTLFNKEL
tara:strand:+ start:10982 stop:11461 length:480 start_codon:yes stop_codon:yes gene_type:complete